MKSSWRIPAGMAGRIPERKSKNNPGGNQCIVFRKSVLGEISEKKTPGRNYGGIPDGKPGEISQKDISKRISVTIIEGIRELIQEGSRDKFLKKWRPGRNS